MHPTGAVPSAPLPPNPPQAGAAFPPAPGQLHGGANRLAVRDLVVLGGAALLLISAFLPFYATDYDSYTTWHWSSVAILLLGFGAGVAAGVLVLVAQLSRAGGTRPVLGLSLHQLTGVLAVVSFAELFLSIAPAQLHGVGQWLGLLGAVA